MLLSAGKLNRESLAFKYLMIFDLASLPRAGEAYALEHSATLSLHSQAGAEYRVHLAWPATDAPSSGWPAVFMLDGETFGIAREIMRYQVGPGATPLAPPRILVAIGYPGASRRHADYGPAAPGEPHAFRRFLLDELYPLVRQSMPIDPSCCTLMGHSLGGLFVLETLFEDGLAAAQSNDAQGRFARYVASSPSVWWQQGHLPEAARRFVQAVRAAPVSHPRTLQVELSAAQYDEALSPAELRLPERARAELEHTRRTRAMVSGNRALAHLLQQVPGLQVDFHVFEDETHRSVWPRAIARALRA